MLMRSVRNSRPARLRGVRSPSARLWIAARGDARGGTQTQWSFRVRHRVAHSQLRPARVFESQEAPLLRESPCRRAPLCGSCWAERRFEVAMVRG